MDNSLIQVGQRARQNARKDKMRAETKCAQDKVQPTHMHDSMGWL